MERWTEWETKYGPGGRYGRVGRGRVREEEKTEGYIYREEVPLEGVGEGEDLI